MPLGPAQLQLLGQLTPNLAGLGPTVDKRRIVEEVMAGLPNSRLRIADALENQAFYDLDGERYAPRRESETEFDYAGRPQSETGFTAEVVDVLCEHQYGTGPARTVVGDEPADALMQTVYETNHINAVMQQAEALSTLNDVACIQVHCTNDPDKPVDLQLWGSEEFEVFLDPDDQRKPVAVVTIDRVGQQTRYRVWFEDEVRTFITEPYSPEKTSGARMAQEVEGSPEPNTYKCLPFVFVHYRDPVRRFWTPGLGTFVRKGEIRMNAKVSDADEALAKYLRPIGKLKNMGPEYSPELGPGRFIRLYKQGTGYAGEDYVGDGEPDAEYLQASLQIDQVWIHVEKLANQILETARVPISAVRMEQTGIASGISLIVEQAPLLSRAKTRRPMFVRYETTLMRCVLVCVGNHYGKPQLVAAAKTVTLLLAWPEPRIPVPGPERDQGDDYELARGYTSEVKVVMERYGLSRDQAIQHIKECAEDRKAVEKYLPQPAVPQDPNAPPDADGDKERPPADPDDDEQDDEDLEREDDDGY